MRKVNVEKGRKRSPEKRHGRSKGQARSSKAKKSRMRLNSHRMIISKSEDALTRKVPELSLDEVNRRVDVYMKEQNVNALSEKIQALNDRSKYLAIAAHNVRASTAKAYDGSESIAEEPFEEAKTKIWKDVNTTTENNQEGEGALEVKEKEGREVGGRRKSADFESFLPSSPNNVSGGEVDPLLLPYPVAADKQVQDLLREEKSVIERRIRADHLRRSRFTEEKLQQKNHKDIVKATVGALKSSKNATDKEVRLQLD